MCRMELMENKQGDPSESPTQRLWAQVNPPTTPLPNFWLPQMPLYNAILHWDARTSEKPHKCYNKLLFLKYNRRDNGVSHGFKLWCWSWVTFSDF